MKEAAEPAKTMRYGFGVWNSASLCFSLLQTPELNEISKFAWSQICWRGRAAREFDGSWPALVVSKMALHRKFIALSLVCNIYFTHPCPPGPLFS